MVFKAKNNFKSRLIEDLNIPQIDPSESELNELKQKISTSFIDRRLNKGLSEVVNAIAYHTSLEAIYLVGTLDDWCETAIKNAIIETK